MQVEEFLEFSAARFPEKEALICGARRLTYAQMNLLADRLANGLIDHGLQRWDRVAIYLENSIPAAAAIFAVLKAGGVFLVINPSTKAEKLAYILNNCRAHSLVTSRNRLENLASCWGQTPHLKNVLLVQGGQDLPQHTGIAFLDFDSVVNAASERPCPKRCIDVDLAALVYTSGSTGRPKGVMLTHLNMVSAATSITTYLENTPQDIILSVLPLSFDYGLYQLLMAFKIGGTLVLERSFTYPHPVLQALERERVTGFPVVPTIASLLLQMDLSQYSFASLRYLTNTAAALPVEHIKRLRRLLPHVRIYSMYGLTECKRVSYLPPEQLDIRPDSVGRGMPNEEVYIVDEQGRRVGPGVVGELVVRGSNVMKGYWELPEETDKVLKTGPFPGEKVLYTGDLFRSDEDGYLYFMGRRDDIIKTKGEKVSPKEIENALYKLPAVLEAAALGVPDPILGQAVKAVVSLRAGAQLSQQELLRHCAEHLEDFMVPKFVEIRESLPKTDSGKIVRRELMGAA
ncbi:MAG: AMP-binding protein [Terriglobales bacterium]